MKSEITVKKEIVAISKILYDKGMVTAFEGNLSVKYDDLIYITPSGICKGNLTEDMIISTAANGKIVTSNSFKPSSELNLHLSIYNQRNDINSIIHTHSPYSTAFALAGREIKSEAYPELIVLYDKVPLAKYGTPVTEEVYDGVIEYVNEFDIILLENHGIISFGENLYNTFLKLESIEGIANTMLFTTILGGEKKYQIIS